MKQLFLFIKIYLTIIWIGISVMSCSEGQIGISDNYINTDSYTALIDTFTIQLSTFKEDSTVSSSTENTLIGNYKHPVLGEQQSIAFFSFSEPTDFVWDEDKELFDSLTLILNGNGYSIGDTCVDCTYTIHELQEMLIKNDDGYLYNTSDFNYSLETIGQTTFRPYPTQNKELEIRLKDDYAQRIISFLLEYKNHEDLSTLFKEMFKGFVIKSDSPTESAIGYELSDDSSFLRLYSHFARQEEESETKDFSVSSGNLQFNKLINHGSGIFFTGIDNRKDLLPEQMSDERAIIQSGSGFKLRIDFPYINNLHELNAKGHIIKAELRLKPDMTLMQSNDLPPYLLIGDLYRANEFWAYLSNTSGESITSTLYIDNLYNENTYYSFDLTNYINARLEEDIIDNELGLEVTISDSHAPNSLNWLIVNGHTANINNSELLLYYYDYDTE